jgi:hypothetical protein
MKLGMKPEVVYIILGVVLIVAALYVSSSSYGTEGFATALGIVPTATQTSAIPSDIPGASSSNPAASRPQGKDIEDVQELLKNFVLLAEARYPKDTNLAGAPLLKVIQLQQQAPVLKTKLAAALTNFDTSGFTVAEFSGLRARIDAATTALRNAVVTAQKAPPTAVQEALTMLNDFSGLATQKRPENTDLIQPLKGNVMVLRDEVPDLEQRLLAAIAQSDASVFTTTRLADLKVRIDKATKALRAANVVGAGAGTQLQATVAVPRPSTDSEFAAVIAAEPQPTVVAGPMGKITVAQLKTLVSRIQEEHLRLSNLRSTSATITARIQQLNLLKANLGDIITKVEMKQMSIEDVPITPDAAEKFLAGLKSDKEPVPPLIVPAASMPSTIKAPTGVAPYGGISGGEQAVQKLLSAAKDLRWSMEVRLEYDPQLKTREKMLMRLENIIGNLNTLAVSETPIPPKIHESYLKELQGIQRGVQSNPPSYKGGDVGAMSRLPTGYAREPTGAPEPSAAAVSTAQGAGFGPQVNTFPHGEISPDVQIRPGFVMNDEQIARRASAASFIPAAGGADYKARALELCRQVKSAQLGDTVSFGCIANPDEVSSGYDWKGNFTMVCNRLGDSWGRSYPEQFGCPPYDPTAKFSSGF